MAFGGEVRRGDSHSILEHFASLGADLYAGDPHPAAPTPTATLAQLGAANPTRRRCQLMAFLIDGTGPRGRVAAMINPLLCDDDGRPFGLLGFFECDDHVDTARRLVDLGLEWLDHEGCRVVRGPINFTTFHNYRLRTATRVAGHIAGEPYHPDYYPGLLRAAGFAPVATYSSNRLPVEVVAGFADRAATCRGHGYTVRNLAGPEDLRALYRLTCAGFASAFMYSPIGEDEFLALYSPDRVGSVGRSSYLAQAPDGEPVGYLYGFPGELDGRPVMIFKSVAVAPGHRSSGVYHLLFHTGYRLQSEAGYREFVGALIHREGTPTQKMGWANADTCLREYELYERRL